MNTGTTYNVADIYTENYYIRYNKISPLLYSPEVLRIAREYYDCPTLPGMQLENEGGGTHWERIIL